MDVLLDYSFDMGKDFGRSTMDYIFVFIKRKIQNSIR